MKLVIDIPERYLEMVKDFDTVNLGRSNYKTIQFQVIKAIQNGTPLPKVIADIKADIEEYEADCILAEDSKECIECDKIVFGSIYNIINKHIGKENE